MYKAYKMVKECVINIKINNNYITSGVKEHNTSLHSWHKIVIYKSQLYLFCVFCSILRRSNWTALHRFKLKRSGWTTSARFNHISLFIKSGPRWFFGLKVTLQTSHKFIKMLNNIIYRVLMNSRKMLTFMEDIR